MRNPAFIFSVGVLLATLACGDSGGSARGGRTLDELYAPYLTLRGDLHMHSSTASFDSRDCGAGCATFSAAEQLAAAREAGLDFAALTEHDRNPNEPGSRMSDAEWQAALDAVRQANSAGFVALAGYEWTSSQRSCFEINPAQPDFAHKIVILPDGAAGRCDSGECTTPDALGKFVQQAGGVAFTPHPWRVVLNEPAQAGYPAFVRRDYFDYQGDGPGGVFVGAEIGPDFEPLRWKVLCAYPDDDIHSQTGTLAEWRQALAQGKHLAALATSDRHYGFTPFRSRTTVLFAGARTPAAILEALKARRTMAANLEPFEIRLAVGDAVLGGTARGSSQGRLHVAAPAQEIATIELWRGGELLETFPPDAAGQDLTFAIAEGNRGPVWVKVTGVEIDQETETPRTTITSPIWVE